MIPDLVQNNLTGDLYVITIEQNFLYGKTKILFFDVIGEDECCVIIIDYYLLRLKH